MSYLKKGTLKEKERFHELLQLYRQNKCSAEEIQFIYQYLQHIGDNELENLLAEGLLDAVPASFLSKATVRHELLEVYNLLEDELFTDNQPPQTFSHRFRRYIPLAAACLLATGIAAYLFLTPKTEPGPAPLTTADALPGSEKATLILADGDSIRLADGKQGIVVTDREVRYSDGTSIAGYAREKKPSEQQELMHLKLTTPRGGQYQVALSDGSTVLLNAGSTLVYPSRFEGTTRSVEIDGEGYFTVSPDKSKPFLVKSKGQQIQVIGTTFNISSYPELGVVKTTLVEGSVKVWADSGTDELHLPSHALVLKQGDQAILSGPELTMTRVDIAAETAWVNGKFSFDGKPFKQVMDELGRWYDLDIEYRGPVPDQHFFGQTYRNENLSIVLKLLKSANITYSITGNQLIIGNTK